MSETGRLTTHVLDTANGHPAAGMKLSLFSISGDERILIKTEVTNGDGRCDSPLLGAGEIHPGVYELVFEVGEYFEAQGIRSDSPAFLGQVPVRFGIGDANAHYHVPLLVAPFSYSTYRGS